MLVDLTLEVTPLLEKTARSNSTHASFGHLGTHFDVMDKTFPLEFTRREGRVFDVRGVQGRDISVGDIDLSLVGQGMFVAFWTGHMEQKGYGTPGYFQKHPQLDPVLIDQLLLKGVSIIAIDAPGVRMGAEHTPMDRHCADRGAFIVENLANLCEVAGCDGLVIHTYPMRFTGLTGLPCRVVAELA